MWRLLLVSVVVFAADPKPQPIPFSHKTHIAEAGQRCRDCHTLSGKGEAAGFPKESYCMGCHVAVKTDSPAIAKLAESARSGTGVHWVRVYRLPANVRFSHKAHVEKATLDCSACHGSVAERDVLVKEKPATSMKFCVDCHESSKAPAACDFCHNSG